MQDKIYMSRSLRLAQLGRFTTHPNPSVGCVIVKDDKIIGEGFHYRAGKPHAEIHALRMADNKAKGATAYVTLEPCIHYGQTPPCCEALVSAGISRVVAAMKDANPQISGRGFQYLRNNGVEVDYGLMQNEAEQLNKGFLKRMRTGIPYIQLKIGASLDGRTSINGESKWITSPQARRDVQYLRAQSHAILTSSSSILTDNPSLTVRWNELNKYIQCIYPKEEIRQPLRIIIDSHNRVKPEHRIVQQPGETWFARIREDNKHWPLNIRQILIPEYNGHIDLKLLVLLLGKYQINSILVEAGPTLTGAFIQMGIIDELIIYLAPKLLGDNAHGLCILPNLKKLADAKRFTFHEICQVGPDLKISLRSTS